MELEEKIKRWRLILGRESQGEFDKMPAYTFGEEDLLMDKALEAIYNQNSTFQFGQTGGAGRGPSHPNISRWLGDVRTLFDKEIVQVVQNDAMERCGLKQLLFEPELLETLEPNVNLASTLLLLKDQVPKQSKESARVFIKKIVDEINRLLDSDIRRAVHAALNKRAHSPLPSASALDFKTTISRGIKNYRKELKRIVPEHFYFFERAAVSAAGKHHIILDIDQSGSMGISVIYSSIMSCILASMASLQTRIVAFDTNVVDLTDKCADPIDLLYGFNLGGGTDIEKSVRYCQGFIENPKKTIFFLISDLCEGGNRAGLLQKLRAMKESGVRVVCLLAIEDGGEPFFDRHMAALISREGITCFACNPQKLPQLLEYTLKGKDLKELEEEH